jgi:hypothetical protein
LRSIERSAEFARLPAPHGCIEENQCADTQYQ